MLGDFPIQKDTETAAELVLSIPELLCPILEATIIQLQHEYTTTGHDRAVFRQSLVYLAMVNSTWASVISKLLWKRPNRLAFTKVRTRERQQHYANMVSELWDWGHWRVLEKCEWPQLEAVELVGPSGQGLLFGVLIRILPSLVHIRHVRLLVRDNTFETFPRPRTSINRQLRHLNALLAVLSKFKRLTSFHLMFKPQDTWDMFTHGPVYDKYKECCVQRLIQLAHSCPQVQEMVLYLNSYGRGSVVADSVLEGSYEQPLVRISDTEMCELARPLPQLRILWLPNFQLESMQCFVELGRHCRELQQLYFGEMQEVLNLSEISQQEPSLFPRLEMNASSGAIFSLSNERTMFAVTTRSAMRGDTEEMFLKHFPTFGDKTIGSHSRPPM